MTKDAGLVSRALDAQRVLRAPPYSPLKLRLLTFMVRNVTLKLPPRYLLKAAATLLLGLLLLLSSQFCALLRSIAVSACHALLGALESGK